MNFSIKKEIFFSLALIFALSVFTLFFRFSSADVVAVIDDSTGTVADNGLCSITEAFINLTNGDQSGSVDCPAGDSSPGVVNIINLDTDVTLIDEWPSASGGYLLAWGGSHLTINGNGYSISRDALADDLGILRIVGAYNYELNDITFADGATDTVDTDIDKGGALAIFAPISVTLNNVTFENNSAVNGGAVYIRKDSSPGTTVEINDSTFENNSATNGAGIYLHTVEDFDIQNTLFVGNTGGGASMGHSAYMLNSIGFVSDSFFSNSGTANMGGAFYLDGSSLEIERSLFNGNRAAEGGAFYLTNGSILNSSNSVFRQSFGFNGGGVIFSYQTEGGAQNEINFYHNTTEGSFDGTYGGGTFFNCIDDGVDCFGLEFGVQNYIFENNIFDINGCDGNIVDAIFTNNLGGQTGQLCGTNDAPTNSDTDLGDHGGPYQTFALRSGSNAIDTAVAGTLGCPDTDARGLPRPYGVACDIGAYEYSGEETITISETAGDTIVTEDGATDTYSISLGKGPSSSVTIDLTKSDTDFDVSPSSITFTTLNWFTPQTVTVSAVDNGDVDGDRERTISHTVTTLDTAYDLIVVADLGVSVIDNDVAPPPAPTFTSSSGSTSVTVNPPAPPVPILGCTISFATNYNPSANQNDGSCIFPVIEIPGCTNPLATNYSQVANTDDGGCILPTPEIPTEDPAPEEVEEVEETEIQETESETDEEEIAPQTPPIDADKPETNIPTEKPTLDERGEVLGQEEVVKVSENISVAGLALPLIAFVVTQPAVAASIPVRLWSIFPTLLGFKRRKRPWGTVYDSVTKQPLDPVHVSLIDEKGKEIATTITDIDGRFGFLVPAGRYKIIVNKNNYEFPSKKMAGKEGDELYGDLYFSEYVEIKGEEDILIKNIPMDPVNFNWNEFEKSKNKNLMKFYSKREVFFANISSVVFYAGLVSSIFLIITSSSVLNYVIFGIYVVVFILKFFNIGPKKPGYVYDSSGFPLSYGIVRVFSAGLNREMSHAVIGKTGKYYSLVRNGEYYLKISRKTGEDSYEEIHKTDIFKVGSGYIKEKISTK